MTQTTGEQVDAFNDILSAYLAENPEQRLGQAIDNLLRDTDGHIPTRWEMWDLPTGALIVRAKMNYIARVS